jgi:hypothetical protein
MTTRASEIQLDRSWAIGRKLHGGYLMMMVVDAASERESGPPARSVAVTGSFVTVPEAGAATVLSRLVRAGRMLTTRHVALVQGDTTCLELLVTAQRLPLPSTKPLYRRSELPCIPPPDECEAVPLPPGAQRHHGFHDHVEMRIAPADLGWARGSPSGVPRLRGWVRARSHEWPADLFQLILADTPVPSLFGLGRFGWVPTVQLQVLVRGTPDPTSWQYIEKTTEVVADGLFDETCELRDCTGNITVQARQLATYRD